MNVGLVGVGGYGQEHLRVLRTLQAGGVCRLTAVADPFARERQPETVAALESDNVAVYDDLPGLLARDDVTAVFIATPIPLHVTQTTLALQYGKHVYLEKPPCATLGEHAQMRAAQQESGGKTCVVGFQMQTSPALRCLKRLLVEGALGDLRTVWAGLRLRRDDVYYDRTPWAGRFFLDGRPVFDGPATNALSHLVHAALFLAGPTEENGANVVRVRGTLKRARPIESYDSAFLEAETATGARVRLCFTHASEKHDTPVLFCRGTRGAAELDWDGRVTLRLEGKPPQSLAFAHEPGIAAALDFLRAAGEADSGRAAHRPFTTLQDTLPYLQFVSGACQSSGGASPFAPALVEQRQGGTPKRHYRVAGLDEQIAAFCQDPAAIPPLLSLDASTWLNVADLSPNLAA